MTRAAFAVLLVALVGSAQEAPTPRFDIIIRGGTIVDGTGLPPVRADVGVIGKWIARVGDLRGAEASLVIDATDLYVTPGFINIHSHASPAALSTAENMLTQGVTLEILNADGGGPIEIRTQLSEVEAGGLAINVGANVGFNSAWTTVVGETDRRPSADEIVKMRDVLAANLEQGAWGVSVPRR